MIEKGPNAIGTLTDRKRGEKRRARRRFMRGSTIFDKIVTLSKQSK